MKFRFLPAERPRGFEAIPQIQWQNWTWQLQNRLSDRLDFERAFDLSGQERDGFQAGGVQFKISTTPYYAGLTNSALGEACPIRRILMPSASEMLSGAQSQRDPLAEDIHSPLECLIHRYSDRVIFLITDTCSVYCRYCTRKRFTGQDQGLVGSALYEKALEYIRRHRGIREVIFSGGDPLTLSNGVLDRALRDVRAIEHVEIIRIGSRMPVVCPMRIDDELALILKAHKPVVLMTHFNHPAELTAEAASSLEKTVDHGTPVFNQMVLLNGVNNHAAIVQALSRRLLYLRVKPYYMFQCDPSEGTDHLRTTVEQSLSIQRELWGHLSGLAMPTLSLDIPNGGGKVTLAPEFEVSSNDTTTEIQPRAVTEVAVGATARNTVGVGAQGVGRQKDVTPAKGSRIYVGWDGRRGEYINPQVPVLVPADVGNYVDEWNELKGAKLTDRKSSGELIRASQDAHTSK